MSTEVNIKEYINSGILELYVLGALEESEMERVTGLVAQHPELLSEVERIEAELLEFGNSSMTDELNQSVLDNALKQIEKDDIGEPSQPQPSVTRSRRLWMNYALAASVAALIGSIFLNFYLLDKFSSATDRISELENQNTVLADELQVEKAIYQDLDDKYAQVTDPGIIKIDLSAVEGREGKVIVYWNPEKQTTLVQVQELPPPPEGMQYQLWALFDDVPIDAGVFDIVDGTQNVKSIKNAQAFAVTLELEGGVASPTLEQLYVLGSV